MENGLKLVDEHGRPIMRNIAKKCIELYGCEITSLDCKPQYEQQEDDLLKEKKPDIEDVDYSSLRFGELEIDMPKVKRKYIDKNKTDLALRSCQYLIEDIDYDTTEGI